MTEDAPPGEWRPRTARWLSAWRWSLFAIVASVAFLAAFGRIGADWDWMVAVGDHIRATGQVVDHVPFAAADTAGWNNVPVLAELVSSLVQQAGALTTLPVHLGLVAGTLAVLAATARSRGASDAVAAAVVGAVVLGSLPALVVVRAQTYSLPLFSVLIALVLRQSLRPDRRIWWAVPLLAFWGNLHGAALLGMCFLGAYLVFGRLRSRPVETVAVGVASLLAICMTPQLWRTPFYYASVFDNVSAQRAEGLWSRPSLTEPFDVLLLLMASVLLVRVLRARPEPWEYVALLGLCLATASAARHGVWLLLVLAALSAGTRPAFDRDREQRAAHPVRSVVALTALATVVALPVALARGDDVLGAPPPVVAAVTDVAGDAVVLAPAPLSESLAVAGVQLWAANPLDAFSRQDQAAYLDFLAGTGSAGAAIDRVSVVVAQRGSVQEELISEDPDFVVRTCGPGWVCFVRARSAGRAR